MSAHLQILEQQAPLVVLGGPTLRPPHFAQKSQKTMFVTDSPQTNAPLGRPWRHQALLTLPAHEAHVSAARHFAADLLDCWSVPGSERDSAVLIVDELAANAAQYGRESMTLLLALDQDTLHIVVTDSGTAVQHRRHDVAPDEHGRGTGIVECLAQSTEVRQTRSGREVRAHLRCPA
ncbi:ATP-binding protein [Streptomyces carpinensis]|uniref:ATP-binding protein n=1 Tax=Streptomyces carpinensis TaxID=66369 RepID=A0ABV1WEM6_9ACTN|nr:ATP-binding protein [Streptomyces carpinensis]